MKLSVFSFIALLSACAAAPNTPIEAKLKTDTLEHEAASDWPLVWSDEFEGSAVDTSKWVYDVNCWGGGNNERQCYTDKPKNAFIKDGVLNITAHQERSVGPAYPPHMRPVGQAHVELSAQPFTSARLTTKGVGDWRYGRIEVRAKLPTGQGTWPAIWMLPTDNFYGGWAKSGEIDIMESVNLGTRCADCSGGVENRVRGTLHYTGEQGGHKSSGGHTVLPSSDDGFNIFAVEWTADKISWFINGTLYSSKTSNEWSSVSAPEGNRGAPFDKRFHLIMNLAIGGGWPERENEGGIDKTAFPKAMQVDWVRVYQP